MSPKTILSSAPPGARTLDTLIKRKGFQSLFYCVFCSFLAVYAVISLCYNELAVDSFQQEGGGVLDLLIAFLVSVVASVVAYYICKWLDGED